MGKVHACFHFPAQTLPVAVHFPWPSSDRKNGGLLQEVAKREVANGGCSSSSTDQVLAQRGLLLVSAHRETDATATAPILQHFFATFGAVSLTEAVATKPASVTGLKSAL